MKKQHTFEPAIIYRIQYNVCGKPPFFGMLRGGF
jgi:hypothetical protein